MHELTAARDRLAVVRVQLRELGLAADDLRTATGACTSLRPQHAIDGDGLRLSLHLERLERRRLDRAADELERRLPDQDLGPREREGRFADENAVRRCGALDPLSGIHRVAGDGIRKDLARQQPGHHLTGVDADADRDLDAVSLLEGGIQRLGGALDR